MNISHLQLFIRVAATSNITSAGNALGLSAAVASNYIQKLEQQLGVRLVHRTTRKVSLTVEGQAFLPHAEDVVASVEAAKSSLGIGQLTLSGTIRITAPASFGRMHLLPIVTDFMQTYPELRVDLKLSDSIVDLVEGGFDVAIRNASLSDSSLVAKKLANDRRVLCASPDYIKQHGTPTCPEDLREHNCLILNHADHWQFTQGGLRYSIKADGNFVTDNGEAIRDACSQGLGITVNSTWSAYRQLISGELVEVLPDYPLDSKTALWAVYPSSRLLAPKVRAFIDFCSGYFSELPYWDAELAK